MVIINNATIKKCTAGFLGHCRHLVAAKDGVVGVTFALSLIPLLLSVGLSIDLGRAYIVKQHLTNTTDAAGLAIGSAIDANTTNAQIQAVLDNFFNANFPSGSLGTVTSSSYTYNGTIITVSAQAEVETTFMKIASINSMSVSATSEITRQENNLELVMVLDNTGSMNSSGKIGDLKTAANSLIDILFGTDTVSSQVQIGLVPFSGTVNIGTSNASYISNSSGWNGCVLAQTSPDDMNDNYTGPWDPLSSSGCPSTLTPLTNVKSTLTSAVSSMSAGGYTHINYGSVWGWRVISNAEPFTEGVSYGTADTTKAMIILTDGENYKSNSSTAYKNDYQTVANLDAKLETVCTNIKTENIIVYTITFQLSDPITQALFESCATDTGKYYNSPTGAELSRVFRAIAAELKQLHVSS